MQTASIIRAVVLDIEGTTTPISFVADVLFPYIRKELSNYLSTHWGEEQLNQDIENLRALAEADAKQGIQDVPLIPRDAPVEEIKSKVVANVFWQMDQDRKSTALKALQGHMWRFGYADGVLKGEVFDDVVPFLEQLKKLHVPTYIYSSGSVEAQKLIFGYSIGGNLLHYFRGHFDTTIGLKVETPSYEAIAKQINEPPHQILFVTDNILEAYAAERAGWVVALADRPGNKPLPADHKFPVVTSLLQLFQETQRFVLPKTERRPCVGVGVCIEKEAGSKLVLMGKRKGSHGAGSYAFPGGHLDYGEDWEHCAQREVAEETGLKIKNVRFATVVNDVEPNYHFVTLIMRADLDGSDQQPKVLEPHRCEEWVWVSWDQLPEPLFSSVAKLRQSGWTLL
jgi:enolase-phosphatase E1